MQSLNSEYLKCLVRWGKRERERERESAGKMTACLPPSSPQRYICACVPDLMNPKRLEINGWRDLKKKLLCSKSHFCEYRKYDANTLEMNSRHQHPFKQELRGLSRKSFPLLCALEVQKSHPTNCWAIFMNIDHCFSNGKLLFKNRAIQFAEDSLTSG